MSGKAWPAVLWLAIPILFWFNLRSGPVPVDIPAAIADLIKGNMSTGRIILFDVRLPRALLALCAGFSLALSGAALQGMLYNPLASPGLLGISQSAALAAVVTLYYGLSGLAWFVLPVSAMTGALLAVVVIFLLAGKFSSMLSIILVGIAVNALTGSMISLALNFAPNPYAVQEIYYWMLGSVANRGINEFLFALPFMAGGWILLLCSRRFLDAMSLGEEAAASLGFNMTRAKWTIIAGVALCTGASVAVSGNIAFVGLVVPHLLRPLVNHEPGRLLPASAAGGAALLLLADAVVQRLPGAQELQLGVITAVIGGPFFLYLIYKDRTAHR